ncbi:hypothetical protein [Ornithinimicrobium sediminis]|uniref:hypothetical protein n=1 Tax=Ornithinimicrobium sediminis TaxID=2904603 RepID=UPI001E2F6779|nr:hypothetical protein [Ornithinimicrobium sediminis]MCE0488137.1 hypothetical protein [Ornithinimicrobium sediminis]
MDSFRQFDFVLALLGTVLAAVRVYFSPSSLEVLQELSGALLGIVLGAVLAGAAIQAAFMDPELLRNLYRIGRDPIRYLRPFLFTATLAVLGLLASFVVALLPPPAVFLSDAEARLTVAAAAMVVTFPALWCVLSLLPCMGMLVQFVGLKSDSALVELPDDD